MEKRKIHTEISDAGSEERQAEVTLRPQSFDTYIGQKDIIDNLRIAIRSAKVRKCPLDHILLYGGAGLGKTSLANVVANEMGAQIKTVSGPAIEKPGDIVSALVTMSENDILFIDEIHRINMVCEETLYSAMEDRFVTVTIGQGMQAKHIRIDLPAFTLIGATTKAGNLSKPLRDRFGLAFKLEYYTDEDLKKIASATAGKYGIVLEDECLQKIAASSRGIPRLCNRNTARVRDLALANDIKDITPSHIDEALRLLGIDENGLDRTDKHILRTLIDASSPVGLHTLSDLLGEDEGTIEGVYEPYLINRGYVAKTGRGRVATDKARELFGIRPAQKEEYEQLSFI